MSAISEHARDLAMNTTGDRVAVVLATLPGHNGQPSWSAYPMRSAPELAAWFDDWVGTPDLYLYLATFDKTSPAWLEDGAPILSRERSDAVTSAGVRFSDVQSTVSRLSVLQNLVAQHETFYAELAQANPRSTQLRAFIAYAWDPFYTRWTLLVTRHGLSDSDADVILEEAAKLAAIRDYATRHGIPVPSLTQGDPDMSNTKVSGGRGGRGGGYHGGGGYRGGYGGGVRDHRGYGGAPAPGFHGRGGYYRHGSAYPGRWWRGGDGRPVWIESDVNLLLENQPSPDDGLPPPSTDDQPIAPDAQGDAPPDRAPISNADGSAASATLDDAAAANDGAAAVQGWRELIAPFLISGRRNAAAAQEGSRALDVAPVLAPGVRPMKLSFAIDGNTLIVNVTADGRTYQAAADLSPIWATLEPRLAAWGGEQVAAARARGHTLMGFSSQYNVSDAAPRRTPAAGPSASWVGAGSGAALVGAGISVSGGCGTRTYGNVTPQVIGAILRGLKDRGADVTGSNPWYAVTHDHGVEFRGTWDQAKQTLAIEVTDSDFYVPCGKVWEAIEPMLADQGAVPTASLERELGETNEQIRALSQSLVAGIVDAHAGAYCAGWFDSITNAIGDAAKGVAKGVASAATSAVGTVGHTLVKLKGPIAMAAGVAAGAGALAIPGVGPFVAPMAGSLASSIVNAAAGDGGDASQAAQAAVTAAATSAKSDPLVAKALGLAQKAAAQTTAAYHVTQTAANAAAGSQDAQKQIAELVNAAQAGDPAATQALTVATAASQAAASNATDSGTTADAAVASSGVIAPLLFGLGGVGAGYFGPDVYHWAKAKWDAHKAKAPAAHP